ncbi:MAG: Tim44/TimA family putative adaptor protein [Proteobacteria bacterium]|nr:Tim44/TimA family putative adaptor protein [Pseudomonadota bacterium]
MQNFDVLTLVFLGLAIFVIYKLRSVLGTRTGTEKPPRDLFERRPPAEEGTKAMPLEGGSNVVPMPGVRREASPPVDPEARLAGLVAKESPAHDGLSRIMDADSDFDPKEFLDGARAAYEMIVMAFANGDRRTLKDLLARDVYEGFEGAIADRESRGEKVETQFVSVDKAEISDAMLRGHSAQVTVRFSSKLITATRDSAGQVIDGNAEKVIDVVDIWTFSRETSARDPNWRLIATESAH